MDKNVKHMFNAPAVLLPAGFHIVATVMKKI
jgi:hypothetical protein